MQFLLAVEKLVKFGGGGGGRMSQGSLCFREA